MTTQLDGDALDIANVTAPGSGTAVIEGGQIRYTPTPGFTGQDSFTYEITDGNLTDTATVNVTVNTVGGPGIILGTEDTDFLSGTPANEVFVPLGGPVDVIDLLDGGADTIEFRGETDNGMREFDYVLGFGEGDLLDLGGVGIRQELNFFGRTFLFLEGDADVIVLFGVNDFDETSQLV